eukprot:m.68990 g.68990  ORF g.68990 m.68990 type:complete len:481 (+) comp16746_c0_seq1:1795-3237(+)
MRSLLLLASAVSLALAASPQGCGTPSKTRVSNTCNGQFFDFSSVLAPGTRGGYFTTPGEHSDTIFFKVGKGGIGAEGLPGTVCSSFVVKPGSSPVAAQQDGYGCRFLGLLSNQQWASSGNVLTVTFQGGEYDEQYEKYRATRVNFKCDSTATTPHFEYNGEMPLLFYTFTVTTNLACSSSPPSPPPPPPPVHPTLPPQRPQISPNFVTFLRSLAGNQIGLAYDMINSRTLHTGFPKSVLQRYDLGFQFVYTGNTCVKTPLTGSPTSYWAFLDQAEYTGEGSFEGEPVSAWALHAGGSVVELGVSLYNENYPVYLDVKTGSDRAISVFDNFKPLDCPPLSTFAVPAICNSEKNNSTQPNKPKLPSAFFAVLKRTVNETADNLYVWSDGHTEALLVPEKDCYAVTETVSAGSWLGWADTPAAVLTDHNAKTVTWSLPLGPTTSSLTVTTSGRPVTLAMQKMDGTAAVYAVVDFQPGMTPTMC